MAKTTIQDINGNYIPGGARPGIRRINAPGTQEGVRRKIKTKAVSREKVGGNINTIVDIQKRNEMNMFSDYDTADRSTSRGHRTLNSDRTKVKSGASKSNNDESYKSNAATSNQIHTPELESIQEYLAISLPTDRSYKVAKVGDRNDATKRFAFRTGVARGSKKHFDSIESGYTEKLPTEESHIAHSKTIAHAEPGPMIQTNM